jgi:N-acetyl-anhydromuramyl-L-alanine amidase AmpD
VVREIDDGDVVTIKPWQHGNFSINGVAIKGRKQWSASEPAWKNEVVYYNTKHTPLSRTFKTIIIHHTDNSDSIKTVENSAKGKGYAAIGYHFFIDKKGVVYEGRPLEIMGSHAGVGSQPGVLFDPDWASIGVVVQGDYHHKDDRAPFNLFSEDVPKKQLQSLEKLIVALKKTYPIQRLLMHREVERKGKSTVCPGDHMVPHIKKIRQKLGISGPKLVLDWADGNGPRI